MKKSKLDIALQSFAAALALINAMGLSQRDSKKIHAVVKDADTIITLSENIRMLREGKTITKTSRYEIDPENGSKSKIGETQVAESFFPDPF